MLVNCNSCQKKFSVPDSAITEYGRLLQCGSCGNKWTQYPLAEKVIKEIKKKIPAKIKKPVSINNVKNQAKKKKRDISLYSEEYLKKKHGLTIKGSLDSRNNEQNSNKKIKNNFGFYGYLITISILIVAFFGFLNLTKEIITSKYPIAGYYINYLFEVVDLIKIFISSLIK